MADLKIYGSWRSRAARSLWCAKELGLPFDQVDITHDEMKQAAYLAINPNGKIPAMADGHFKLFESMAIDLYLAKKHGLGKFYPSNIEDEGLTWQWTLWTATEVEPAIGPAIGFHFFQRGTQADYDEAVKKLLTVLKVLDGVLAHRKWLTGEHFMVADLNVASGMGAARMLKIDLSSVPHVADWFGRSMSRMPEN